MHTHSTPLTGLVVWAVVGAGGLGLRLGLGGGGPFLGGLRGLGARLGHGVGGAQGDQQRRGFVQPTWHIPLKPTTNKRKKKKKKKKKINKQSK